MKRFTILAVMTGLLFVASGCSSAISPKRFTQAQLTAIETRIVDASMSDTYSAASGALFDAGYTISMSDREGGLLTGAQGKDNTAARIWVSPLIRDTAFVVSIRVMEINSQISEVRIKTSINGEPTVDKKAIDQIWVLMQRQVLMRTPPSIEGNTQEITPSKNKAYAKPTNQDSSDTTDISKYSESTQAWILKKSDP